MTLTRVLAAQRGLLTRSQALAHVSPGDLRRALASEWRAVLPGVYSVTGGDLDAEQRQMAGVLYGGPTARLTDVGALALAGVRFLPSDDMVRIVVDWNVRRQSRNFVVVTRTRFLPAPTTSDHEMLPVCPVPRALVDFGSRSTELSTVRAVFADAVQRRIAPLDEIARAAEQGPRAGRAFVGQVLVELRDGIRSAPEGEFRALALATRRVPKPLFNALLRLPDGRHISPDALVVDAGLVHETNGRLAHAEDDLFESMQERHDVMTAAGLTVLHNPPGRIARAGRIVRLEWERCYARLAGSGLPPGVTLVRLGPP